MGAVWLRSRAELRSRWKAWLAVALLAGIGGGIAIGAFAGAERVEHTYPDFVESGHPMDVLVPGASRFGLVGQVDLADVGRLPEVAETADASAALLFAGRTPDGRQIGPGDVFPVAAAGNALGTTFEQWTMLEGRAAHPLEAHEATASFLAAEKLHLQVGDTLRIHFFSADTFLKTAGALLTQFDLRLNSRGRGPGADYARFADGPELAFKIVGIEASPGEFPPLPADISPPIHLTRAFYEQYNDRVVQSPLLYTRLERGTVDLPSFERRVERMGGDQPVAFVTTRATQSIRVQRAIRVQATALRIFGTIVLLAFVVLILQTLSASRPGRGPRRPGAACDRDVEPPAARAPAGLGRDRGRAGGPARGRARDAALAVRDRRARPQRGPPSELLGRRDGLRRRGRVRARRPAARHALARAPPGARRPGLERRRNGPPTRRGPHRR